MFYRAHSVVIRTLYRMFAPRHPRGWIDMHAVFEDDERPNTLWIHTHGLERWNLENIEMVGVPVALRGYAHGLLFDIMGYMKEQQPIHPDEHIGGMFVAEQQRIYHMATARRMERPLDPAHRSMLRFVDYNAPLDAGFPKRLFAAHLCALADEERSRTRKSEMYRTAIQLYPGEVPSTLPPELHEQDVVSNANNWAAWEGLGNTLIDQGKHEEGLACLEHAVARCSAAAQEIIAMVEQAMAKGELGATNGDPRVNFWMTLDIEATYKKVRERG